jgi:hypothetical protein
MRTRKATKWLGAVVAALTLSMVTSVSAASAATAGTRAGHDRWDTSWSGS